MSQPARLPRALDNFASHHGPIPSMVFIAVIDGRRPYTTRLPCSALLSTRAHCGMREKEGRQSHERLQDARGTLVLETARKSLQRCIEALAPRRNNARPCKRRRGAQAQRAKAGARDLVDERRVRTCSLKRVHESAQHRAEADPLARVAAVPCFLHTAR